MAFLYTPKGFFASCEVLNELSTALITDIVSSVKFSTAASSSVNIYKLYLASTPSTPELFTLDQITGSINALKFILNELSTKKITEKTAILDTLQNNASLIPSIANAIVEGYLQGSSKVDQFTLGHVIGCDWKLGMGLSSNSCTSLKAPFVTLMLKIADANGVRNHPLELTISQFQSLHATLIELDSTLQSM